MLLRDDGESWRVCEQGCSRVRLGGLRAWPGAHLGSSAGRHSTEWYKLFTATSHSRSTVDVLSKLWSVATLGAEGTVSEVGETRQDRAAAQHLGSAPGLSLPSATQPWARTCPPHSCFLVCNTVVQIFH